MKEVGDETEEKEGERMTDGARRRSCGEGER